MGRFLTAASVWGGVSLLLVATQARAYTPTISSNGVQVRWAPAPFLNLAGNPKNTSALSEQSFRSAVVHSLQRWQTAAGGAVQFDYWQGTDASVYEPSSDYNGLSSIYFVSNGKSNSQMTSNVLGLTQVWYDTSSGKVLETDIVLNDRDFHFTTDPRDTSGYGSSQSSFAGGKSNVYIENVITHELGHALGLSHSGGLQSTMLFMESPEQAHLGCDELAAIRAVYPAGDAAVRGELFGAVTAGGKPVFGAHVVAISRQRGTVLATALTDKAGNYRISALEPGTYFLLVEPFYAGSATLPGYYSGARADVCSGGRTFGRTFVTENSSYALKPFVVESGRNTNVPPVEVSCNDYGGASVAATSAAAYSSSAPQIFDGNGSGFGIADRFSGAGTAYYKVRNISGHLVVHAMSYSLYSPVRPSLTLLDSDGHEVKTVVADEVYTGDSGYVNYDSELQVDGLIPGDYQIRVTAHNMDATLYPAGPVSLDPVPFLVLTGSVNESEPALAGTIATNARCRMAESFAPYVSPPGGPRRSADAEGSGSGVGFCGTVASGNGGKGGRGGGSGAGSPDTAAIVSWFLPWLFMGWSARRFRSKLAVAGRQV